MAQRPDRTTKILLGLIAALLAVIAFRPLLGGQNAYAQVGSPSTGGGTDRTSFRAELVNRIVFRDTIVDVTPMDTSHVFLVRTANNVEVYRVDDLPVTN